MSKLRHIRRESLEKLQTSQQDIVVIGGGITGAGILRDAALRGLHVALFEKDDFAHGTSSRSSKLIHGGLRYLETFDFKLVFEACSERRRLLELAPQWVKPLPFLYPVYADNRRSLAEVAAGVWLYDLLALFRNIHHPSLFAHEATLQQEPLLVSDNLKGGALYYDAVTNDTELTLGALFSKPSNGVAHNHVEVSDILIREGRVIGVQIRDTLDHRTYRIHSKWIVQATGPWTDENRHRWFGEEKKTLRPTKGVHIVVEHEKLPVKQALLLHAPRDQRVTFVIPWMSHVLVGTTDTDFVGSPDDVTATTDDIDYLLEIVERYFPTCHIERGDVISSWAGLRPLLDSRKDSPSAISREHAIHMDRPGFVTISGGKLTTFRKMAEDCLTFMIRRTPEWRTLTRYCPTRTTSFENNSSLTSAPPSSKERIWFEMTSRSACTVADLLEGRLSSLHLDRDHGQNLISFISGELKEAYGYSANEIQKQLEVYQKLVRQVSTP